MSWAAQEFAGLELGDARRTQRVIKWVNDLSVQPTGSIPQACGGSPETPETKAAYRLLDNPAVEWLFRDPRTAPGRSWQAHGRKRAG